METAACLDATISCGTSRSGSLTTDDCVFPSKEYYDAWQFSGIAGQTVTISMNSTAFDTYLELHDPSGAYAASNDDTSTTNSRITYRLPVTGTWRIFASSARDTVTGSYDLSLTCVDLGTPNFTPVKPANWSDAIVVSTATFPTDPPFLDTPGLTASDTLHFAFAFHNIGTANADPSYNLSTRSGSRLFIDGVLLGGCNAGQWPTVGTQYLYCAPSQTSRLASGIHTLRVDIDPDNIVPESNETDNSYTRTITVIGGSNAVCTPTLTIACLNNRFAVSANWVANNQNGQATAVRLTTDTSYFWFFNAATAEVIVKEVDGRAVNGRFWFFAGGLTNADVTLTVTDVQTGQVRTYRNPANTAFQPVQDTSAF